MAKNDGYRDSEKIWEYVKKRDELRSIQETEKEPTGGDMPNRQPRGGGKG